MYCKIYLMILGFPMLLWAFTGGGWFVQVFKMTALRGLKLIFPADVNPLYAGFGNSVSDMVAFKKARKRKNASFMTVLCRISWMSTVIIVVIVVFDDEEYKPMGDFPSR